MSILIIEVDLHGLGHLNFILKMNYIWLRAYVRMSTILVLYLQFGVSTN